MSHEPELVREALFAMQVCVPKDWTDAQVEEFAEQKRMAGTIYGWQVRKDESDPERVDCADREGMVHVVVVV